MSLFDSSQRLFSQKTKASALLGLGLGEFARRKLSEQVAILTFHGLKKGDVDDQVLDSSLHLPQWRFEAVCRHLKKRCHVLPLRVVAEALSQGKSLPTNATVITFDDGHLSNATLAFPILKRLELPATVFLTTGFLDGEECLWFQRLDLALKRTRLNRFRDQPLQSEADRRAVLRALLTELKAMPDDDMRKELQVIEQTLGMKAPQSADLPEAMRPMGWEQVREMAASGLVEFGGHTHTHPILARCTAEQQAREIQTCRDRISEETGITPTSFAYTNGGAGDYTAETMNLLREAGFRVACTMVHGRWTSKSEELQVPRYGSPESAPEAHATVTGAFELLRQWRGHRQGGGA